MVSMTPFLFALSKRSDFKFEIQVYSFAAYCGRVVACQTLPSYHRESRSGFTTPCMDALLNGTYGILFREKLIGN